jgi:cytochrome c-type biogenesis protein CcmH
MKLIIYFIKLVSLLICFSLLSPLLANKTDKVIEEDLKKITSKLRCMTCQNQTIYDSDADFSLDIKKIVGEKLQNGEKEKEIIDFLIHRYGEYIIFKPQLNNQNFFLWYFPFVILALSLVFLIFQTRKN